MDVIDLRYDSSSEACRRAGLQKVQDWYAGRARHVPYSRILMTGNLYQREAAASCARREVIEEFRNLHGRDPTVVVICNFGVEAIGLR